MGNWLLMQIGILRKKRKGDGDVRAIENLVELACGGVTVTTERRGVRYKTVLQIDGDVIQKCEIPSETEDEHIGLVWMDHIERVNSNLESVNKVVDRLVQNIVNVVSVALALFGIGAVFSLVSEIGSEVTVKATIWSLLGGVPGLVFVRFGKRVTAIVFRSVLSRRLESIGAKYTGTSAQ